MAPSGGAEPHAGFVCSRRRDLGATRRRCGAPVLNRVGSEAEARDAASQRAATSSEAASGAIPWAFRLRDVRQERAGTMLLDRLTVDLPRGGFTALIGPSGAGKTSLLRLLNRLDDPVAGSVAFLERPITEYPVRLLRRRVGFVFQAPVMFAGTVRDNLAVAQRLGGSSEGLTAPEVARLLELVELGPAFADRIAVDLSGGEKQRVALARALVTRPEVLLLDEPTAALDPEVADRLMHTLARLRTDAGLTMVMVTHRLGEARGAATYVVMLESGRVVEAGEAARVMEQPAQARTREFLAAGEDR